MKTCIILGGYSELKPREKTPNPAGQTYLSAPGGSKRGTNRVRPEALRVHHTTSRRDYLSGLAEVAVLLNEVHTLFIAPAQR